MRKLNLLWTLSGILLVVCLIVMLSGIAFGIDIPDTVIRISGIGALVFLGAFAFMTFRKVFSKK